MDQEMVAELRREIAQVWKSEDLVDTTLLRLIEEIVEILAQPSPTESLATSSQEISFFRDKPVPAEEYLKQFNP